MIALGDAIKHITPSIINVAGNSLKDHEIHNILVNLNGNIKLLNLSNNKLSCKSLNLLTISIKSNRVMIANINLENNKLSSSSIIGLCNILSDNH